MLFFQDRTSKKSHVCNVMQRNEAKHTDFLLRIEIQWLSRGKILARVYDLRNELFVFLTKEERDEAKLLASNV